MQAVVPGTRAISNRAAAALVVAGLWFFVPLAVAEFSSGGLTEFLAGHIAAEASEFDEIRMTRKDVATWMEKQERRACHCRSRHCHRKSAKLCMGSSECSRGEARRHRMLNLCTH